jgi:hypothetical protein
MLFFIAIHGGLRIMMGQHSRSESLFYYFRIEDQVPENHLLRLIDRHISFDFVREKLMVLAADGQVTLGEGDAACQRRARSRAATAPPCNGSIARSAAPQKAPPVSFGS